ncbi:MAG: ATP-binding protein [Vicinamibacterales bacterium]|nr:ATP-binding protein [Vicinamibacterales bacterium]
MKVAFIGTHGVGKTTLCYDLVASLKRRGVNADMVKEVARLSPLPINRQTSLDAQIWILMTQVAEEIRSAAQHDAVVCDRSVLDNYAYLARACGRQPEVEAFVVHWMRSYDRLFKVPITGLATPDGVRDVDDGFVTGIDALVDTLLAEHRIGHVRLEGRDRGRWVSMALDAVVAELAPRH